MLPRRRPRWRLLVVPLLGAWLGAVVTLCLLAVRDLQRGADTLGTARAELDLGELASGSVADDLGDARASFAAARRRVTNPLLLPLRPLPVVGRHLRSVTALSRAAASVTQTAERAVRSSSAVVRTPPADGEARLETLEVLRAVVREARSDLAPVSLGPDRALAGPLARRRAAFAEDLAQARSALRRADAALSTALDLLRGPRRYLLLVGSNAEMRAGSGAFLSVGILETGGGSLRIARTVAAGDITLDPPDAVTYPAVAADLEARWGWLEPNREWRNLGLSPRFPASAARAAAMWEAAGETGNVDGVLALDVEAVRAIVAATGPVTVGDRTFEERDVVPYLLHDQYVEAGAQLGGRLDERRELLGALAGAAVAAVQSGNVAIAELADGLAGAVRGRHLMAWSAAPAQQAGWAAAGAAGDLPADALLLGVVNRGANKLDPFLGVEATVGVDGQRRTATVVVDLHNRAAASGEPAYVAGPNPLTGTAAGEYKGIVTLNVPGFASDITIDGVSPTAVAGRDGETNVVGGEVRLPPGGRAKVTVRFALPAGARSMTVQPSARIPAATWTFRGADFTDVEARTLHW
jgi:hypothetical protein